MTASGFRRIGADCAAAAGLLGKNSLGLLRSDQGQSRAIAGFMQYAFLRMYGANARRHRCRHFLQTHSPASSLLAVAAR
ncbi:MAG TPA: hypothetical protein VN028_01270 [Rhodocyclaceae bacterium]|nr:hypothetical protein [Rhodocyclaceae bacterium]